MSIHSIPALKDCYIMQHEDIERFADTLADGFSQYNLFKHLCNGTYDIDKMRLFWRLTITLLPPNAICIADSKEANSVLIYTRPQSKEAGFFAYLKTGGIKMIFKWGIRGIIRLTRFEAESQRVAKQYKTANDGYLMAFATRLDKQGQHYGKPLIKALLDYLDASGEGCYLETLKAENVGLYQHFSFQLKEQKNIQTGKLTMFAMLRPGNFTS